MSKLRNSRPGTAAVMTAHHLAAACCSAAAMLWLPPTHCLSGWWQSLTGAAPSLLSMWCGSQCLMIESQRTQTFKPEGSKIVNIPKMVYQETPPLRRPCRHWRTHTDTCATWWFCLPVCPLLQVGLPRGEAQHDPETPQLRQAHCHQVWQAQVSREGRVGHCALGSCHCGELADSGFLFLPVEEWKTDDQYRAVCQDAEMYQRCCGAR